MISWVLLRGPGVNSVNQSQRKSFFHVQVNAATKRFEAGHVESDLQFFH